MRVAFCSMLCRRTQSMLPGIHRRGYATTLPLSGHIAWVIGGVGTMGAGIAHGLIRAGATVIVNSRHPERLERLSEELDHPENLVTVASSMLSDQAEKTVATVMEMTGHRLDHVAAHGGVNWWSRDGGDESATLVARYASLLHAPANDYAQASSALGGFHHSAAQALIPHLREQGSYTFVTSAASGAWGARSSVSQVNAHGLIGLAAALCSEAADDKWNIRVGELRLGDGLRLNRSASERESDPRHRPLSRDVGAVVAGMAAGKSDGGCVAAADVFELEMLKTRY